MSAVRSEIEKALEGSEEIIFTNSDFLHLSSKAHISKILGSLCQEGRLIRVSIGIYAKAEISPISGKPYIPMAPMEIALIVMKKLGIDAKIGSSYREYNEGRSTQVPSAAVVDVGKSRINRKIKLGKRELIYERSI